jgi:WD40 repeat protein/tetratricopeptide (TPR) repeat protein
VPGYELLSEMGRGGMGVVYRARQTRLGRVVALKMILAGGHADEQELKRFRNEAEAVARLQHPNIVQIHEVGEHEGLPFLSLEFCGGESLENKLAGTPLPPAEAAALVETLARAMHAAHQKGVVHRDLKPANVLLTEDGLPKITDFGLAKRLDDIGHTATGTVMGTPSYMAPEQARGTGGATAPAVDVYALGALLYECLTGRPPFRAATTLDTLAQVVSDDPVPPRRLQPKTPRDLETICLTCLRKEPAKRYASAGELADDLHRFLRDEPIAARPTGPAERLAKWVHRRPAVAGLLAAVALVAALGAAGVWWKYRDAQQQRDWAEEQTRLKGEALEAARQAQKEADEARAEAQQKAVQLRDQLDRAELLAYVGKITLADRESEAHHLGRAAEVLDDCRPDYRGWEHRHLRQRCACGREVLVFGRHNLNVFAVAFSPDGSRAVSSGRAEEAAGGGIPGELLVWDVRTGATLLTLKGHRGGVTGVAYSPDGGRIASASADRTVRVWDAHTGAEVVTCKGHGAEVTGVAFSPDGGRVASSSLDKTARVWDARTGAELVQFAGHTAGVYGVAFDPAGDRVGSVGTDQVVRVWDGRTAVEVAALKGHTQPVWGVAFSPDGSRIASCGGKLDRQKPPQAGEVRVWDAKTGAELLQLKGHRWLVRSVAFSPDANRLVTASSDGTVKVWDAKTGAEEITLRGHTGAVGQAAYSPDGSRLASASADKTVKVWDARTGGEVLLLGGHANSVNGVAFSPDGGRLVSGAGDGTVKVWDARTGGEVLSFKAGALVHAVALSPDGSHLATASGGVDAQKRTHPGELKVWDARTGAEVLSLQGYTGRGRSLAFSPDGSRLAGAGPDRTALAWDLRTGAAVLTLRGHAGEVVAVAFSRDGGRIATGALDQTVRVWDAATGSELATLRGHTGIVTAVAFSPDGGRVAGASLDHTVRVWDSRSGAELLTLKGHTGMVQGVAFSPDGSRIASAGGSGNPQDVAGAAQPGEVKVWDARAGSELLTLRGHTAVVQAVAFSPDGRRIASGSYDHTVRVWEGQADAPALPLLGHMGEVKSVVFAPDGDRLATTSQDQTVKVWDARGGAELLSLKGHRGMVTAAAFSPDGGRLASGAYDHTVKVWDARRGGELRTLRGHKEPVWAVAISPDGSRLASASGFEAPDKHLPGEVKVWDMATGALLLTLTGHTRRSRGVAFSADGRQVISRSQREVKAWDAATGDPLPVPEDLPPLPTGARATSPDGRLVAWVNGDRSYVQETAEADPEAAPRRRQEDERATLAWHQQQAYAAEQAGNWFAAAFHLNCLPHDGPEWYRLHARRLRPHARLGRWPEATDDLLRVIGDRSDAGRLWQERLLGINTDWEDYPRLLAEMDGRLARDPGPWIDWAARGRLHVVLGHWQSAAADLAEACRREPGRLWLWATRARVALKCDREEEADAAAARLGAVSAEDVAGWHRREADQCEQEKDWRSARWHLARLLDTKPADAPALCARRGWAAAEVGRWAEAAAAYARACELRGPEEGLLRAQAHACLAGGDHAGYRRCCAKLLEKYGATTDPLQANNVAWTCALTPHAVDHFDPVLALSRKAVAGRPNSYPDLNTLGCVLLRAGRPEEAVVKLKESLALRSRGGIPAVSDELLLALASRKRGQADEARRWLDRAEAWFAQPGARAGAGLAGLGPGGLLASLPTLAALSGAPDPRRVAVGWEAWTELQALLQEAQKACAAK